MKRLLVICILFLGSLSSYAAPDKTAPLTSIPEGSFFRLDRDIEIQASRGSVFFIKGQIVSFPSEKTLNALESFCFLTVKRESKKSRTIAGDTILQVTGVSNSESDEYGYITDFSINEGLTSTISCHHKKAFPTMGDFMKHTSGVFEIIWANQ